MQIPREPRVGEKLDWAWGQQVTRYLRAITPTGGLFLKARQWAGGTTFEAVGSGGGGPVDTSCPFDISIVDDGIGGLKAVFRAGTINQLLPDNYLTGVTVPGAGTKYLRLNCTANNGAITAATFAATDDPPGAIAPFAGQPPTAFSVLIGIVVDGVALKVWGCGNIQALGVESFRLQKAVPVAGQLPYDVYYTWDIGLLA